MNRRFSTSHILIFVIAMSMAFASPARSENSMRDDLCEAFNECELTWVEKKLKALKDFADKIDEDIANFKRLKDNLSKGGRSGGTAEPDEEPLPRVSIEKSREQLQKDLLDSVISAHRQQNNLVWDTERALVAYVSAGVERCKKFIAAGDETGARASCGTAQAMIEQCRAKVEPEIDRRAAKLTAEYREIYQGVDSVSTRFSRIHCDLVFSKIEDPGKLLRTANFQLHDSSCYIHVEQVKSLAKTGSGPNSLKAILKGDVSVPAYLSFIERNCPERITQLARREVDEILKAKEEARPPEENKETTVLERRGGSGSAAMFQGAMRQAEQEEKDRPAREAREREAQARATEEERIAREKAAAEARAFEQEQARKREQRSRETSEALGQLLGVVGQIQQNKADRRQAQYGEQQRSVAQGNGAGNTNSTASADSDLGGSCYVARLCDKCRRGIQSTTVYTSRRDGCNPYEPMRDGMGWKREWRCISCKKPCWWVDLAGQSRSLCSD